MSTILYSIILYLQNSQAISLPLGFLGLANLPISKMKESKTRAMSEALRKSGLVQESLSGICMHCLMGVRVVILSGGSSNDTVIQVRLQRFGTFLENAAWGGFS